MFCCYIKTGIYRTIKQQKYEEDINVFLAVTAGTALLAQSGDEEMFHFRAMEDKLDDSAIDLAFIRGHFMGEEVAKKLYLLRERYTWVEEESSTNLHQKPI